MSEGSGGPTAASALQTASLTIPLSNPLLATGSGPDAALRASADGSTNAREDAITWDVVASDIAETGGRPSTRPSSGCKLGPWAEAQGSKTSTTATRSKVAATRITSPTLKSLAATGVKADRRV